MTGVTIRPVNASRKALNVAHLIVLLLCGLSRTDMRELRHVLMLFIILATMTIGGRKLRLETEGLETVKQDKLQAFDSM